MRLDTGTGRLLVDLDGGVAQVTFNNPDKHNALGADMLAALPPALAALQRDPEVRVVVLTGAGDRAFVSGADISEFEERRTTPEGRSAYDQAWTAVNRAWADLDKPLLAMIRGYCIGGGLLTALRADIRVAAEGSQFGVPAARLGLGYGYPGVKTLVDLVGPSWTAEILFSARRLAADEALRIGLVNRVVPADRLEDEVRELARSICANAPLTVAACRAAIREAVRDPDHRDLARVADLVEACFRSEDYVEGQRAFREKRAPRFTGR
ncbi:MAG TPA: enoyl-CoA hydratase [Terriglobales bacterium]|nr:enoyl-CoA hydratase [Terriglobales bacterium]